MKKLLFTLTALFVCFFAVYSQVHDFTPPDFKLIEKNITEASSPYYYPELMKRFKSGDSSLTTEDYRHLYYGFSFQDNYQPYGKSDHQKEVSELMNKETLQGNDIDKIIDLEKKILTEYPFNLRNIYTLETMYGKKGDKEAEAAASKQLVGIAKAIISTGDGKTDTSAMFVISVEHEYDMIGLLGFNFAGSQSLVFSKQGETDKLALEKNDNGIKELYFNVGRLFEKMKKLFEKD